MSKDYQRRLDTRRALRVRISLFLSEFFLWVCACCWRIHLPELLVWPLTGGGPTTLFRGGLSPRLRMEQSLHSLTAPSPPAPVAEFDVPTGGADPLQTVEGCETPLTPRGSREKAAPVSPRHPGGTWGPLLRDMARAHHWGPSSLQTRPHSASPQPFSLNWTNSSREGKNSPPLMRVADCGLSKLLSEHSLLSPPHGKPSALPGSKPPALCTALLSWWVRVMYMGCQ